MEAQALVFSTLNTSVIEYEKRVVENFRMHEEHFDSKLYNLVIRRDKQDNKLEEMRLVN